MEMRSDGRAHTDEVSGGEPASGFLWPPPADARLATDVVDLETNTILSLDEAASAAAEYHVAAPPDLATPQQPAARPRMSSGASRVLIGLLAALAVAEGLVIALRFSDWGLTRPLLLSRAGDRIAPESTGSSSGPRMQPPDVMPPAAAGPLGGSAAVANAVGSGGELHVRTDERGAVVIVDGQKRGTTPLTVKGLAPGPHRVRLVTGRISVEETVTVESGVASSLVVRMVSSRPAAGWVDVAMPFEVHIFEEGRLVGTSAQPRLQFRAGEHRLMLINQALGYRALERVRVRSGEVAKLQPRVPTGLLSINALPWAEVWIDRRPAGTTPLANLRVPLGTHEIRFHHPDFGEQTRRVVVTALEPARVGLGFRQ